MKTKTESKHTPGPWEFERESIYLELEKSGGKKLEPHEGYFRDNDGSWIVKPGIGRANYRGDKKRGADQDPDPEGMANARLIAAAPDLLAAAKALLEWADGKNPAGNSIVLQGALRIACAKAEGR